VLQTKGEVQDAAESTAQSSAPIDLLQARAVLAAVEGGADAGDASLRPVASAIRLEIAIAQAEEAARPDGPAGERDPLFRLRTERWAVGDPELAGLMATRDPLLRIITFDVSAMRKGPGRGLPASPAPEPRHVVAFAQANGERREPLFVSAQAARILELSDGTRTVLEIVEESGSDKGPGGSRRVLRQIEALFVSGLLWLQEPPSDHLAADRVATQSRGIPRLYRREAIDTGSSPARLRANLPVPRLPFLRSGIGQLAQGRWRKPELLGRAADELQDAAHGALQIPDQVLVDQFERGNIVLPEKLTPTQLVASRGANERVDLVEIEPRLSGAVGLVSQPPGIDVPSIGLLGAIVRDRPGNFIPAGEPNVAEARKGGTQDFRHTGRNLAGLRADKAFGLCNQGHELLPMDLGAEYAVGRRGGSDDRAEIAVVVLIHLAQNSPDPRIVERHAAEVAMRPARDARAQQRVAEKRAPGPFAAANEI